MYLVAGGYADFEAIASTELLVQGASSWTEAGPLPQPMQGLQAISIDNQVISTGGFIMCNV